jgi:hypothetical protein
MKGRGEKDTKGKEGKGNKSTRKKEGNLQEFGVLLAPLRAWL